MKKEDLRSTPVSGKLALRKTAIRMIQSGVKKKEVASHLGVNKNTITNWWKSYQIDGAKSYHYKKRGVKSEDKKLLTARQEEAIQRMIIDKMPDQLKFSFALWTRKAVKELVEREFGVVLGLSTMGDYLRKWGYTPQKPKHRAYEQCTKKVQQWLNTEYPKIKAEAQKEGAEIHWADETGVKNQCNHGRSYAPKGRTPVKKAMAKRFSINMVSAITNQGKVQFMLYSERMNAEKFIEFLEQLIKSSTQKIYVILDNLRVHHSKKVKAWREEHEEKIRLFFLPAYSPELNPDEYLNCDLKQGMSAKKAPRNKEQLENNVKDHMDMLTTKPERVKKYFMHEAIKYAA